MEENNTASILSNKTNSLLYILLVLYYSLNLLGSPLLKFLFPALLLTSALAILLEKSLVRALFPMLAMSFLIGQGKILWSYHPVFHIAFDYLQILFIFKVLIRQKKIINLTTLPLYLLIPIILHLLWYGVQLFNFYNVGFIGTLAAGRAYVLPVIFFLTVLNTPFENETSEFGRLSKLILASFAGVSLVALNQHFQGQDFLVSIASYYQVIMGLAFVDDFFRPFSTTELPGGYTIYFAVLVGLVFLRPLSYRYQFLFFSVVLPLSVASSIISQVRSAYIKYFAILFLSFVSILFVQKVTAMNIIKRFAPALGTMAVLVVLLSNFLSDLNIENSIERLGSLVDPTVIASTRSSPDVILKVIQERLVQHPLGLGPGRTGAAAGFAKDRIARDPQYGLSHSWAYDNLFVSLATDLGVGMFLFLAIVFISLLLLFSLSFNLFIKGKKDSYQMVAVPAVSCLIIFTGNWGAIGLSYNPEAFGFWLLAGLGIRLGLVHVKS